MKSGKKKAFRNYWVLQEEFHTNLLQCYLKNEFGFKKKKQPHLAWSLANRAYSTPIPNHTQLGWKEDSCLGTSVLQFEVHLIFIELFEPCVPSAERHAFVGREFLSSFNINV